MSTTLTTLVIAAVCFRNDDGFILTVRKRGTAKFMLPGGKLEPGEHPRAAAIREIGEETGIELAGADLTLLGHWMTPAANEANTQIDSTVFTAPLAGRTPRIAAEIEEMAWLDPAAATGRTDLAPLLRDYVIPALRRD